MLSEYLDRLEKHKEHYALQYIVEPEKLNASLNNIQSRKSEPDMHIIKIIRLLYLSNNNDINNIDDSTKNRIITTLRDFPYWSHLNEESPNDVIFWSENHIIMMLSSAHLMKQYLYFHDATISKSKNKDTFLTQHHILEEKLLKLYLEGHCKMAGMYECLSHVYLPYTISALLNLYDFSIDDYIKTLASKILNIIVHQILLCTTEEGIATLSASSRSFHRTRTRIRGHNINELIYLYTGKGVDGHSDSCQLTDFLLTTNWVPDESTLHAYLFKGFIQMSVSHEIEDIRGAYCNPDVDSLECIPFYWSAGLLYHPDFIKDTKRYMKIKRLGHRKNLWPLRFIPSVLVSSISKSFSHLTSGQCYLGVTLNVYKNRNTCLSSYEKFQVNSASFQQLSWIANIEGIPIWSMSGRGSEGVAGFAMNSTYNPYCSQKGKLLVVSYYPPLKYRNEIIRLFWPSPLFDKEKRENEWWVGQKKGSFVGIFCTKPTLLQTNESKDAVLETLYESKTKIPRRCYDKGGGMSWVVIVGSNDEYESIDAFLSRCQTIDIKEQCIHNNYTAACHDQIEGDIKITISN